MLAVSLYVLCIILVNLGFSYVPPVDIGFGVFSPMAIFVGAIFVFRDFAQRAVGHYVLLAMLAGGLISYGLADPFVAIASVAAFLISEGVDWLLYTVTKKPFHKRVLISSALSTPIDSFVFLSMIGQAGAATLAIMVLCKMLAAIAIYYYGEQKEPNWAT